MNSAFDISPEPLDQLVHILRHTPAMQSKQNIGLSVQVNTPLSVSSYQDLYALPGDDTAAIFYHDQYVLHACEGMIPQFVEQYPYFAGWSAVMANVSDIAAMGGRALSVVNSFWHHSHVQAQQLMQGMTDACDCYGIAMVGGHTHVAQDLQPALSVAIQGHAKKLLSVMHVKPQQQLLLVLNMQGVFHPNTTYWKCFEGVQPEILRRQLDILPQLAEQQLAHAARDISNAGILGSLLMLLEASAMGADVDLSAIPKPSETTWAHWLQLFPSYGFLLSADEQHCAAIIAKFAEQDLSCVVIGQTNTSGKVRLKQHAQHAEFWDFQTAAFTGMRYPHLLDQLNAAQAKPDNTQHILQTKEQEQYLCQA